MESGLSPSWSAVAGAAGYRVIYTYQLGDGANSETSQGSTTTSNTSTNIGVNVNAISDGRRVVRWSVVVHTIDSEGTVGGPSDVFTIDGAAASLPTLPNPRGTVTPQNSGIIVNWQAVTGASTYDVEYRRTTATN